jgi:hypothetical protein
MAALTGLVAAGLALAIAVAVPSDKALPAAQTTLQASPEIERWRPMIIEASRRFGIPQAWISAVMQAESGGLTAWAGRPITSSAGAMGLMQVMPDTYGAMRRLHHLGPDPYEPHDNILAGAAYLRLLEDRFGYPGLFAAYNAGPARYADYLRAGVALPSETQSYIANFTRLPADPSMPTTAAFGTRLFFILGSARIVSSTPAERTLVEVSGASSGLSDRASEPPEPVPAVRNGPFVVLGAPPAAGR